VFRITNQASLENYYDNDDSFLNSPENQLDEPYYPYDGFLNNANSELGSMNQEGNMEQGD
jgi:hypothetical protein